MDLMTVLTVVGTITSIVGTIAAVWVYKKPRVFFDVLGNGVLVRCLTTPVFKEGWGIVTVSGKLRVSNHPVTVVDAELSYKMDQQHQRPNSKSMGSTFPPLFVFQRVANDERASTVSSPRQNFEAIKLMKFGLT